MKFTLDSVKLFCSGLEARNKGKKADFRPKFFEGTEMNELVNNTENYYFGILTAHQSNKCTPTFNGKDLIICEGGNQIILGFQSCEFLDNLDGAVANPLGSFLGFEITLQ